jgi:hypothetical protein
MLPALGPGQVVELVSLSLVQETALPLGVVKPQQLTWEAWLRQRMGRPYQFQMGPLRQRPRPRQTVRGRVRGRRQAPRSWTQALQPRCRSQVSLRLLRPARRPWQPTPQYHCRRQHQHQHQQ